MFKPHPSPSPKREGNFFLFFVLIGVYLLNFSSFVFAKEHFIDQFESNYCEKNFSTQGMIECTHKAYEMWDGELNKYYKLLRNKLSSKEKQDLKTAQIAWIGFRDKEFQNIDNIYGKMDGTMYLNMKEGEKREIVKGRVLVLENYYRLLLEN